MHVIATLKVLKKEYPDEIVLLKNGSFYQVYGMDACVFSYLFDYKLRIIEEGNYLSGFPVKNLEKIQKVLRENNISFTMVNDTRKITEKCNFEEKNKYEEIAQTAYAYVKVKEKIENINKYFLMNMNQIETLALISQVNEIITDLQLKLEKE